MKRWTLRILLFLLLGSIVNVAVAWACVMLEPSPKWILHESASRQDEIEIPPAMLKL